MQVSTEHGRCALQIAREDPVGEDTYPHVYGPINADAVLAAIPLARA